MNLFIKLLLLFFTSSAVAKDFICTRTKVFGNNNEIKLSSSVSTWPYVNVTQQSSIQADDYYQINQNLLAWNNEQVCFRNVQVLMFCNLNENLPGADLSLNCPNNSVKLEVKTDEQGQTSAACFEDGELKRTYKLGTCTEVNYEEKFPKKQ